MATDGAVSVHTSDRGTFKKCRQLWSFSSNIRGNLESIPTSMGALSFGTGIHEALAAYYTSGRLGSVVAVSVWNAYCNAQPYEVLEEGDHSRQLGINMLENYHRWAKDNDKMKFIASEVEVNLPILRLRRPLGNYPTGTVVEYSYRLDGLVQDEHGRYWIREYKTSASFDSTYDYLLNDDQCGSYLWAEQKRRGVPIEGVDYIILRKAYPKPLRELKDGSLSLDKKQDTDYATASAQIMAKHEGKIPEQYREFLGYLLEKPNNFVRNFPVRRNQQEIATVELSLRWEIQEMLDDPKIYRTSGAAWDSPCKNCSFFSPCVARWEGSDFQTMLKLNYRQREPYRPAERAT